MANPYENKGPNQFWREAVASPKYSDVSPIPVKRFCISRGSRIATAGSCFAQHVSSTVRQLDGLEFLQIEPVEQGQPLYSAAFGNIYTMAQLRQLFEEAFGLRTLPVAAWQRDDGRWVDGHRPTIFKDGFATSAEVSPAR